MHNQSEATRRGAVFRATLTSSERPNINIIALNIISCAEKVFFCCFFFLNGVAGITETFIILDTPLLASGTATWTLTICLVCHEFTVAKDVFEP